MTAKGANLRKLNQRFFAVSFKLTNFSDYSMAGHYYFVMVSQTDRPVFEIEFLHPNAANNPKREDQRHLSQFIAHAALDVLDEQVWTSPAMYLKVVDKFNEWYVSAFVTASRMRLLLLHDVKNEDGIKTFFQDMYETYIKYAMNPFFKFDEPITSAAFQRKAQMCGRRYLTN